MGVTRDPQTSPKMRARQDPSLPSASTRGERERRVLLAARSLVDRMRQLYRELEQMTDAPISMHRALNAIGEYPGIQASQLATALGMQRPAVSQIVNGMVERGWIEREAPAGDRRRRFGYGRPDQGRGRVDREVDPGIHHGGREQRHHVTVGIALIVSWFVVGRAG